ncbi:MAG: YsnF/AvaK domain-containing protein [Chloroflexota bacterium]|nr:YsnF/AvaK domain-containing protein [Chloroflexota bacterium]
MTECHAVDRPVQPGAVIYMTDQVIHVPAYEEQALLQKQVRVPEEVGIGRQSKQEQQTLTGTTRCEGIKAVQSGNVEVRATVVQVQTKQTGQQKKKRH